MYVGHFIIFRVVVRETVQRLPLPRSMTTHLFTVDVEEYYQVAALEPYVGASNGSSFETRVVYATELLLDTLAEFHAHGTFFALGDLGERVPALIRRIAAEGHEVASHGWSHKSVIRLKAQQFRDEVARSRAILSDVSGQDVVGFRAPNFSIVRGWEWAYDVLLEQGYEYDSSTFPGRRLHEGASDSVTIIERSGGQLLEFPMTCAHFGAARLPAAGGAWFRLFPYDVTRRALKQAADRKQPGVFYIHPWELDPDQPRLRVNTLTHIRHYGGLKGTLQRLRRMLGEFSFTSVERWRAEHGAAVLSSAA